MKTTIINEGLDFHDMEGQIDPTVTVDEYVAKMGKDKDIVTLTFVVKSEQCAKDLVDWFERGYDFVLDASVSEGEYEVGKWLVFVEMNRRSTVPSRIIELLQDLKTLTNIKLTDWTINVDDEEYDADEDVLKQVIIMNPAKYKMEKENEEELNEMRGLAGLDHKKIFEKDTDILDFVSKAGL